MEDRFRGCSTEKNGAPLLYDIIEVLRKRYNEVQDEEVKSKALQLIATKTDLKYRKNYAAVWKILVKTNIGKAV